MSGTSEVQGRRPRWGINSDLLKETRQKKNPDSSRASSAHSEQEHRCHIPAARVCDHQLDHKRLMTCSSKWHKGGRMAAVQCSALRTHTGRILQSPPVARRCSNSLLIASSRRSPTLPPSAQPPSCAQAAALADNVSHISPLLGLCFSGRLLGRKRAQQTDCFPCASCTLADHLSDLMGDRIEDNI